MQLGHRQTKVQWVQIVFDGSKSGLSGHRLANPQSPEGPRLQAWTAQ